MNFLRFVRFLEFPILSTGLLMLNFPLAFLASFGVAYLFLLNVY